VFVLLSTSSCLYVNGAHENTKTGRTKERRNRVTLGCSSAAACTMQTKTGDPDEQPEERADINETYKRDGNSASDSI
jgi:hypothetical protein